MWLARAHLSPRCERDLVLKNQQADHAIFLAPFHIYG